MGKEKRKRFTLTLVDKNRLESCIRLVLDDQLEIFTVHRNTRIRLIAAEFFSPKSMVQGVMMHKSG
jgi:hypothetical protein